MAAAPMDDWTAVAACALALPSSEAATSYGRPAIKVRGKTFVSTGPEADSFHLAATHEEKAVLLESDPTVFWQTPHFANWPGLLVRYGARDTDRIAALIARAWWDRASKADRTGFGPRP